MVSEWHHRQYGRTFLLIAHLQHRVGYHEHDLYSLRWDLRQLCQFTKYDSKTIIKLYCLKHRKQEHTNIVPPCKNERNGTCRIGSLNCWLNHTYLQNSNKNENSEQLEKINEKLIEKSKSDDEKTRHRNIEKSWMTQEIVL